VRLERASSRQTSQQIGQPLSRIAAIVAAIGLFVVGVYPLMFRAPATQLHGSTAAGHDTVVTELSANDLTRWPATSRASGDSSSASLGSEDSSNLSTATAGQNGPMTGVACVSTRECWGVGTVWSRGVTESALIDLYNGSEWMPYTSPNTTGYAYQLYGVTCLTAGDCWTVGDALAVDGGQLQTLIEHYSATQWSVAASPDETSNQNNVLNSVTCDSATDCWAVGYAASLSGSQTLIEHYNGSRWGLDASVPSSGVLTSVSCASATNCWAVGQLDIEQVLIEHFDGTSWTIAPSPAVSGSVASLQGIDCLSAGTCWAVGYYEPSSYSYFTQGLIESYSGSAWTIAQSAVASDDDALFGVFCLAAVDCWTVGHDADDNDSYTTTVRLGRWMLARTPTTTTTRLTAWLA
jgi:hypothetical protein